jgi:rsbT co-antagonist protein RsbR
MIDEEPTKDSLLAEVAALRAKVAELDRASEELARLKSAPRAPLHTGTLDLEQEFCRVLLEHLPDGVVACNSEGALILFNKTSRDWHGMDAMKQPPEEWASCYDLFGPDGETPLATEQIPLVRAFRGEHVRDAGMVIVARGQEPRHILSSGEPILDLNGRQIGAVAIMHDVTAQRIAEQQSIKQAEIIRAQTLALAELSTPLIPISDDVVVMPLVGVLDSQRTQQIMATLLTGISERRARVAILDITGVSVVDTYVANGLLRAARSAELLGSQVVLTGIRPEVALSLVQIGADLGRIVTRGTLQSGIAYAMSAKSER